METDAPSVGRQACGVHLDRAAVERCQSCGRPACIVCAVPVRGRVLCSECAARDVGAPRLAPPTVPRRAGKLDLAVALLFGVGLLSSLLPWDRFGILTSAFAGWRVDPDPWPLVASVCELAGAGTAVAVLVPRRMLLSGGITRLGYAVLGAAAAAATAITVYGAPDYVTHTPAPYVGMVASAAAAVLGIAVPRRAA